MMWKLFRVVLCCAFNPLKCIIPYVVTVSLSLIVNKTHVIAVLAVMIILGRLLCGEMMVVARSFSLIL